MVTVVAALITVPGEGDCVTVIPEEQLSDVAVKNA